MTGETCKKRVMACIPTSPKSPVSWLSPLPLWSSSSELSEMLFPRLLSSFCPKQNWTHNSSCCASFVSQHLCSVQSLSRATLCDPTDCSTRACLSITAPRSPPKRTSIESVMPSNHRILCRPLLLLPSIFPNIRVFSKESIHLFHDKRTSLTDPVCYFATKMRQAIGKTL